MTHRIFRNLSLLTLLLVAASCVGVASWQLASLTTSAFVEGRVIHTSSIGDVTERRFNYAINGAYRLLKPGLVTVGGGDTVDYQGIELTAGSAYVKMFDPVPGAAVPLPSPFGVAELTLDDPALYVPVVMSVLYDRELRRGKSMEGFAPIAEAFESALFAASRNEALRANLTEAALIRQMKRISLDDAIDQLPAIALDQRQFESVRIVYEIAGIKPDDLPRLFILTKYPFIIAKRTIGGAEGTEIVVHVNQTSATSAEVYYFYLYSSSSKPIDVGGYEVNGPFYYWKSRPVKQGHYAKLLMEKKNLGNGGLEWCAQKWVPKAIASIAAGSKERAAFDAAVKPSHLLACKFGMKPHGPMEYLGVKLECP